MKLIRFYLAAALFFYGVNSSIAQSAIASAEASFSYIASTLQTFRNTGRLVNNPGIDGADLEAFIDLLEFYYDEFSRGFNRDSAMCQFYLDPENGRMTIEDKAALSFSFLRDLDDRVELYMSVDEEFQNQVVDEFGSFLLDKINADKLESSNSQRLPASEFDEAAIISFIDSMCI